MGSVWPRAAGGDTTNPSMIALARRVKESLDPEGILNPGVFWGDLPGVG
jgi:FAD/FMN-containing dehydrogenase